MKNTHLKTFANYIEFVLAVIVLIGTVFYFVNSSFLLFTLDWALTDTMYTLIDIVITTAVGVELAKILITHDIYSVSDLLVFVVARKLLQPSYDGLETLLLVASFAVLIFISVYIRKYSKN